jgi:broad specificity phosphatase PhoE
MQNGLPKLYLVRHGNTDWAETGKHTGRSDVPLNSRGEERAAGLVNRLAGLTFARVFSSPLKRAARTCELAGFGANAEVCEDLLEWDYGQYEGLTSAEIEKIHPGWELFHDGAPGGESPADVAARADRFIAKVRQIEGDVIAFSSGHIIRMIAGRWLGMQPIFGRCFFTATASIGVLSYEHKRAEPVVRLWNEEGRPGDAK